LPSPRHEGIKGGTGTSPLIPNHGVRWRRVVNITSLPLYPGVRTQYPFNIRRGEPKSQSGHSGEEKNQMPLSESKLWTIQTAASLYTYCLIKGQ